MLTLLALLACTCDTGPTDATPASAGRFDGIVEGFYGEPWSEQERLDMVRWAGEAGFTGYVYAPKAGVKHRLLWRQPYDAAALAHFADLVAAAEAGGLTWCYAVAPGLDIHYADDLNRAALLDKLLSVGEVGARCFALLLDDIPGELSDEDALVHDSFGQAHLELAQWLLGELGARDASDRLLFCPTEYAGTGSSDYLDEPVPGDAVTLDLGEERNVGRLVVLSDGGLDASLVGRRGEETIDLGTLPATAYAEIEVDATLDGLELRFQGEAPATVHEITLWAD